MKIAAQPLRRLNDIAAWAMGRGYSEKKERKEAKRRGAVRTNAKRQAKKENRTDSAAKPNDTLLVRS